ncbi:MAG: DUF47 family protein [Verrucomicrobiota bacterium]|nr:DUF47 family protein [Verrucomicrobiota bacterium]
MRLGGNPGHDPTNELSGSLYAMSQTQRGVGSFSVPKPLLSMNLADWPRVSTLIPVTTNGAALPASLMPRQLFLPVARDDLLSFVRQLDRMGDGVEDFGVVATFRKLEIPRDLQPEFSALVNKVIQVSEALLAAAEGLAQLQKTAFEGAEAEHVLTSIQEVCRLEWESDLLSREFGRHCYSIPGLDPIVIMLLDKLCRTLTGIADHAENVGKSLRLMILRH